MKWIPTANKNIFPKNSENIIILFESGKIRRLMETDLPIEIITHYMEVYPPDESNTNDLEIKLQQLSRKGEDLETRLIQAMNQINELELELIRLRDSSVTGESEAIERGRNTQYTYYHVDFINCPSFDGDYMICKSIEEIKGLLELVDADLDDPLTKCSVEIKGVGMTPDEYDEWVKENF